MLYPKFNGPGLHSCPITVCVISVALLVFVMPMASRAQQNGSYVPQAVNRTPSPADQNQMWQQQRDDARIEAANAERKKEISADSTKLLKMAAELNDELDKTDQDTLSLDSIRKIEAIEKLARSMKDKLRLRSN